MLLNLPNELLYHLLTFMTLSEILSAGLICKYFQRLLKSLKGKDIEIDCIPNKFPKFLKHNYLIVTDEQISAYYYHQALTRNLRIRKSRLVGVKVTDLTPFHHASKLIFNNCSLPSDLSSLSNCSSICLQYCRSVTDVSPLSNLKFLNLIGTEVTDISMLGNLHTLYLSGKLITDVSMLGNLHTLYLNRSSVTDVSALGRVKYLDLSFTNVTDVSALGGGEYLNLRGTLVTNVSTLGSLDTLDLRDTEVTDLTPVRSVRNLILDRQYDDQDMCTSRLLAAVEGFLYSILVYMIFSYLG